MQSLKIRNNKMNTLDLVKRYRADITNYIVNEVITDSSLHYAFEDEVQTLSQAAWLTGKPMCYSSYCIAYHHYLEAE